MRTGRDLEHAHRQNAKIIQGLPSNIATPAPLATLGWLSIEAHIAIMKLTFLWKILCLLVNNIYRRIVIFVILQIQTGVIDTNRCYLRSPIVGMYQLVKTYGFLEMLKDGINSDDFGCFLEKKRLVRKRVLESELNRWKATCIMHEQLDMYVETNNRTAMHPWWIFSRNMPNMMRKVASVMALLMGGQPRALQRNIEGRRCRICETLENDDSVHVLFICSSLHKIRGPSWKKIVETMPTAMARDIDSLSYRNRLSCLLSGFWRQLYS